MLSVQAIPCSAPLFYSSYRLCHWSLPATHQCHQTWLLYTQWLSRSWTPRSLIFSPVSTLAGVLQPQTGCPGWLGLVPTPALSLQSAWMQMARAPWLPTKDNIDIDEVFSCAR